MPGDQARNLRCSTLGRDPAREKAARPSGSRLRGRRLGAYDVARLFRPRSLSWCVLSLFELLCRVGKHLLLDRPVSLK